MKTKLLLLAAALCVATVGQAQIQIGSAEVPTGNRAGKLDEEDLEAFKKMTTVFYIPSHQKNKKADYEKVLSAVWTINPFKVATIEDMGSYADGNKYANFGFGGYVIEKRSSNGMSTTYSHISYDLGIPNFNKKGEQKGRTLLARVALMPDKNTLRESMRKVGNKKHERELTELLYTSSTYNNFEPGFIKAYAKLVNDMLLEKTRRGIYNEIVEKEELKKLQTSKLYIPNYVNIKFNIFNGSEKDTDGDEKDDELAKAYPTQAEYIDDDKLQEKILNAKEPFYYLIYTRSSTDKYVAVCEALSGRIIYADYIPMSYNFKIKDLKKIARFVN